MSNVVRFLPETPRGQQFTPSGRLLPPLHKWDRISLRKQHATKGWKELSDKLDEATAQLATAASKDQDDCLDRWLNAAAMVLASGLAKEDDVRTLLALASVFLGCRKPVDCIWKTPTLSPPPTRSEMALGILDWNIARIKIGYGGDTRPSRPTHELRDPTPFDHC